MPRKQFVPRRDPADRPVSRAYQLSKQSFSLIPKIREVDLIMRSDSIARQKVHEVHPELLFWSMNHGKPLEHAKRISRELALAAARRAGAADPHVETTLSEKLALVGPGADYLAEAVARSTATGRPLASLHAGRADAPHIG